MRFTTQVDNLNVIIRQNLTGISPAFSFIHLPFPPHRLRISPLPSPLPFPLRQAPTWQRAPTAASCIWFLIRLLLCERKCRRSHSFHKKSGSLSPKPNNFPPFLGSHQHEGFSLLCIFGSHPHHFILASIPSNHLKSPQISLFSNILCYWSDPPPNHRWSALDPAYVPRVNDSFVLVQCALAQGASLQWSCFSKPDPGGLELGWSLLGTGCFLMPRVPPVSFRTPNPATISMVLCGVDEGSCSPICQARTFFLGPNFGILRISEVVGFFKLITESTNH